MANDWQDTAGDLVGKTKGFIGGDGTSGGSTAGDHEMLVVAFEDAGAAQRVLDTMKQLEAHLGVHAGQTTQDGRITLGHEECLGSCGTAPMMRIDNRYCENLDFEEARRIVDSLE